MFQISKHELEKLVKESTGYRDVARKVGSYHRRIKELMVFYKIEAPHFCFGKTVKNSIGKKFGKLTIIEDVTSKTHHQNKNFVLCLCDCGNHKEIRYDLLIGGKYVSCGCHVKNRWSVMGALNPAFCGVGEIRKSWFKQLKRKAENRGLQFKVTIQYLWELFEMQDRKCALTHMPLKFGTVYDANQTSASLDRINNRKGYLKGNVRWVLKDINMIRKNLDTEYFIRLCNLVSFQNPRDIKSLLEKIGFNI